MSQLFHTILYQPLFNLLVFFYNVIPGQDAGVAIIFLTLLVKVVMFPLTSKSVTAQRKIQEIQPKIKEIQERHKEDKVTQTQETMKAYQEHGVNPLSGCLPLLIQLPILIALFQVFVSGFTTESLKDLYAFVANPGSLDPISFGIINLAKSSMALAAVAAALQFYHTYLISGKDVMKKGSGEDFSKLMQRQTLFMMPILTFIISLSLPAALPFYWVVNTLISIGEHYIIGKRMATSKGTIHITD